MIKITKMKVDQMEKIKVLCKYDSNYSITSPTDAYGGMNPKGKLIMNYFTDIHTPPISQTHELNEKRQINPDVPSVDIFEMEKEKPEKDMFYFDRILHNTVILSPDDAINIALWMIDTVCNEPSSQIDKEKLQKHLLKIIDKKEDEKK